MQMGETCVAPLFESGDAPRILVTGFERVDHTADGIWTYVGTRTIRIGGKEERQVVLYIDVTMAAIVRGIVLSFFNVEGLMERLRASRFLTFH